MSHEKIVDPSTSKEFLDRLEKITNDYSNERNIFLSANPSLDVSDPSVAIYTSISKVLVHSLIHARLMETSLLNSQWWQGNFLGNIKNDDERLTWIKSYNIYYKTTFLTQFTNNFESSIRRLLRSINPKACNNSADKDFMKIVSCLAIELGKDFSSYGPCLNISRVMRNSFHNNGSFYSSALTDRKPTSYRGVSYIFKHGEEIDFASWGLIFAIIEDHLNFIKFILSHEKGRSNIIKK